MPANFSLSSPPTSGGVILDIGTGDGRFVYQMARKNPGRLYIGIDASSEALVKISAKAHRNPEHGGARNALFLQARVEELPPELDGVADEVHIHFPWGSLLGALLRPEAPVLRRLRAVCKEEALVEIITSIDMARDSSELSRLGINGVIDEKYVDDVLVPPFAQAGLSISERGLIAPGRWPALCTAWAARLKAGGARPALYIIARACQA